MMKVRRVLSRNQSESDLVGAGFRSDYGQMHLSAVTGLWERLGLLWVAVVISLPRSSAQTVPGAGLCSVLGAPRQRGWFCGSRAPSRGKRGIGALLLKRVTQSEYV